MKLGDYRLVFVVVGLVGVCLLHLENHKVMQNKCIGMRYS